MEIPFQHPDLHYWKIASGERMDLAKKVRDTSTCYKQKVGAVICDRLGTVLAIGTNAVKTPQESCPRAELPTGTAYELCKEACGGNLHAEIAALQMLNETDEPYGVYLYGHWWLCEDCCNALAAAGIKNVYLHAYHGPDTDWNEV